MGAPAAWMNFAALLGAVLHLGLISIVAYRMGYRWRWLPVPWIITVVLSAVQQLSVYNEAEKADLSLDGFAFFSSSIAQCAAYAVVIALAVLAVRGQRKANLQSTELANAYR